MPRPKSSQSVEALIVTKIARVRKSRGVQLVGATDFSAQGSRRAVDVTLHRLARAGILRRLDRGLYYVPRSHPVLGEIRPTPETVARAYAARQHCRIQPSGAHAANLLGLSEQVPLKLVYLTNGASRRIKVGRQEILLKRTTPKIMATAGRMSGVVIQALRYLGRRNVDDETVLALRRRLSPADRRQMLKDAPLAPAWIAEVMRRIAAEQDR